MADPIKIGQKVEVVNKGIYGVIAFIGKTSFAAGKWIGLVLDEPKGKNDGTVQNIEYFKCEPNYGMFVRETQIQPIDDEGRPIPVPKMDPPASVSKIARSRTSTSGMKTQPTASRMSLASSIQSLANSRTSLGGSRQSLSGSRSQLASPSVEKCPEGGDNGGQHPKRSSFVETGFVETLKPQFTPGAMITTPTPVSSMEDKLTHMQLQVELDNRTQQIQDLTEKIETLKLRRQDDKEKLKDYDKLRIQLEQLVEFKSKIMEAQNSLQRELQKSKQDAKEAIAEKEAHMEEVADLYETMEMATLDKEMAEEKAELLQAELDACKEELEEVTTNLKTLKSEIEKKAIGSSSSIDEQDISVYEIKQLQQQNARLRDTLVKLRDLSAHEKHEHQKLLKEMDQKQSEIAELSKKKELLTARVEDMEQQISDLQEQVDAALGAEEMVVALSEQKLSLQDKVAELQEEVAELEELQDMNDQMLESNEEIQAELREELDMALGAIREAKRERDAALETVADREVTIKQFRTLVQTLQEQSRNLQTLLEKESSKPVNPLPEIADFGKMFTETKAHTKAIDLELRKVDVQQLQQHIKYLSSYMPDSFMNRGGDHDAMLILLLVPRLFHKLDLLLGQIKDKFPTADKVDKNSVLKGHTVERYSFRCRMSYYIHALQSILHQYYYTLNSCKPETLLKVGATYPEMVGQEKIVDGFIELIKKDQLDENVSLEPFEKCFNYFNTLYPVFLGEEKLNQNQLVGDYLKLLLSAVEAFNTDASVVRCLAESANVGDICLLSQYVITTSEQLQQQLKLAKRRLPNDIDIIDLCLDKDVQEKLLICLQQAGRVMKTMYDVAKAATIHISTSGEMDKGIPGDKLKEIAMTASDRVYGQDDLGPIQSIKNSLSALLTQATSLATSLQDNELNFRKEQNPTTSPIQLRAEHVKKEMEQTKTLTSRLENKESDIKELKKHLKEKQEQLSEMTIRKELAEKKLATVHKDYELKMENNQRKLEEAQNNYQRKVKEFEETMDHLQNDIDALEKEKGVLRQTVKQLHNSDKSEVMKESLKMESSSGSLSLSQSLGPSLPAVVKDSPMMRQEIDNLRKLFHQERNERIKLQNAKLKQQLDSMTPLPTFKNTRDAVIEELYQEGAALKQEILTSLANPIFPPIYKVKAGNGEAAWMRHFAEEHNKMADLKKRAELFQTKVGQEAVKRRHGGHIEADFNIFPTKEMVNAIKEIEPINMGHIKIPKSYFSPNDKPGLVNLDVDLSGLQQILSTLC